MLYREKLYVKYSEECLVLNKHHLNVVYYYFYYIVIPFPVSSTSNFQRTLAVKLIMNYV